MPLTALSLETRAQLRSDSVFIFPTETLYGIGCSIHSETAIARVLKIKNRGQSQPPPVLIADSQQLHELATGIPSLAHELIAKLWPGALTLVLPACDELPEVLCGLSDDGKTKTIGVRHTAHPVAAALCKVLSSPIIATSANFSGATGRAAAPRSLEEIPSELKQLVDFVIDGGRVGDLPSTVIDCVAHPPRILRAGACVVELP